MSTEDVRWARHIAFLEYEKGKKIEAASNAGHEGAVVGYDGEIGMLNLAIHNAKVEKYVAEHGQPPHWAMGGDQVMLDGVEMPEVSIRIRCQDCETEWWDDRYALFSCPVCHSENFGPKEE